MTDNEKRRLKQWVEAWKRAGPMLEQFRYEELRAFRHEDNVDLIDALLEIGYRHRQNRPTSGLVEQQRWFMKMRR